MQQIVYMSQANRVFSTEELLEMARSFRDFNQRHDISGLMFLYHGCFVQVLEGPEAEVRALYERLASDPRHKHLLTLVDRAVPEREFPDWAMALAEVTEADLAARPEVRQLFAWETGETAPAPGVAAGFLHGLRDQLQRRDTESGRRTGR